MTFVLGEVGEAFICAIMFILEGEGHFKTSYPQTAGLWAGTIPIST